MPTRVFLLTSLAMIAFAGNSLLCRQALKNTTIDPVSFTLVRVVSGAIALWLIVQIRQRGRTLAGSWLSAIALFGYAAGFSLAYVSLPAGIGALLLFEAVQAAMITYGLCVGERFRWLQIIGILLAMGGFVGLLLPGLTAPPLRGAVLMVAAGFAWGVYSLRGKHTSDPTAATSGNFMRAVPLAVGLSVVMYSQTTIDSSGVVYAIISGAVTSGIGYAIWYTALGGLKATTAATVQLSVPVLAAAGGILFLGEHVTVRLIVSSVSILGGIALVVYYKQRPD